MVMLKESPAMPIKQTKSPAKVITLHSSHRRPLMPYLHTDRHLEPQSIPSQWCGLAPTSRQRVLIVSVPPVNMHHVTASATRTHIACMVTNTYSLVYSHMYSHILTHCSSQQARHDWLLHSHIYIHLYTHIHLRISTHSRQGMIGYWSHLLPK